MSADLPQTPSHDGETAGPVGADEAFAALYDDLRRLAERHLVQERRGHTLQPTALAHEAWLRLRSQRAGLPSDRAAFCAAASSAIRRVLVDHARARASAKRGGGVLRVDVDAPAGEGPHAVELIALDEALAGLAAVHPRQARVVELRFFGGLGGDEAALVLGVSPRTVDDDWRVARAWLAARLATEGPRAS